MKNKFILAFILIYLITLIGCLNNPIVPIEKGTNDIIEGDNSKPTLDNNSFILTERDLDISIDGNIINYKMLKEEITSILGQPLDEIDYDNYETYRYDGIEVTFMGSYVDFLVINNSAYSTYRGVSIGANIEKMFESYGKIDPVDIHDSHKYYMYSLMNDGLEIQLFFVEDKNKIKEYYFSNGL